MGAAVAGSVREACGAGVGAAVRAVHGPAQQRSVAGRAGRRRVDRVAAPVQPDGGGADRTGQVQRSGVVARLRPRVGEHVTAGTPLAWILARLPASRGYNCNSFAADLEATVRIGVPSAPRSKIPALACGK